MTDYRHDIEKYLKGKLSPAERHALERKALHDPFLADALEGAEQLDAHSFATDVAELNNRIAGKKTVSVWVWTARIAASILLVLVSTFIIWSLVETEPEQKLALEEKISPSETQPSTSDSAAVTGELSSPSTSAQPSAGPTSQDQLALRSQSSEEKDKTTFPLAVPNKQNAPVIKPDVAVAETKAEEKKKDEIKVTEPIARTEAPAAVPIVKETEIEKAEAEDDKAKISQTRDTRKKIATDKDALDASKGYMSGFAANLKTIKGKVTAAEDGSPVPGVNVVIKGTNIGTMTDAGGNYEVQVEDPKTTLVFSFIGYQSTEVALNDKSEVDVKLPLDATELSEVVVVGYTVTVGERDPLPTVNLAHPEVGQRAFKQYLEKNVRYPEEAIEKQIEGRVTVQFTIQPNGSLSDFNVLRGIGGGCDEELIRLIKEGPKWAPTVKDDVPVSGKAKVRMRFSLPKK